MLLYLHPFPIFRFPRLIIHEDSLRVVLYLSSATIPMEPDFFSARVHAGLGAGWSYCHWAIGWEPFQRFCTPAHCVVGVCRWCWLNSLKTIRYFELHGMWHRSQVARFVHLVHYKGLLWPLSPRGRGFLLIRSWQHWFDCYLESGSSRIVLSSAWIIDHSLFSWSTNSRKCCDRLFCRGCRNHLIDYSSTSTAVSLPYSLVD